MKSDDWLQVRSFAVNFYVLKDEAGLYLIDAGFLWWRRDLNRALKSRGWENEPIVGIIVTHGHLDHILNVGRLAKETGAWIAAPRLDAAHYRGKAKYSGISRVTAFLEWLGRPLLGFQTFEPDRLLDDGDELDIWHGLKVVHLPGHTDGHSGFYCEPLKLLFAADLFVTYGDATYLPPAIFNNEGSEILKSVKKALSLPLEGVLPNHGSDYSPEEHLQRMKSLVK